jgi:hypothetical protein
VSFEEILENVQEQEEDKEFRESQPARAIDLRCPICSTMLSKSPVCRCNPTVSYHRHYDCDDELCPFLGAIVLEYPRPPLAWRGK